MSDISEFGHWPKVQIFFHLLRAAYGADTIDRKWPDAKDKQLIGSLKRELIESLTLEEIRAAIDNAGKQKANGIEEFYYIDIDTILNGAKNRSLNSTDVIALLEAPPETQEQKEARKEAGKRHIQNLRIQLNRARNCK